MSKIIVPVSGGKDSTSCLLLALKTGQEVIPVFHETGWDAPEVYEYLAYLEKTLNLVIQKTVWEEAKTLPELIRQYRKFPFGVGRFCTSTFKRQAFSRFLDSIEGDGEIWLGIRDSESQQRKKKYGFLVAEETYSLDEVYPNRYPKRISSRFLLRFPILHWEAWETIVYIEEAGLKINPLYNQGFDRVGCFPCMLAGKSTHEKVFRTEFGKKQLAIIKQLEQEIGEEYKYSETDSQGCSFCQE